MPTYSKVVDRLKLIAWALVFVAGVLLVAPIALMVAGSTASQHGIVVGVLTGLFAAGFVGFSITAAAMSRTSDLRRLSPHEKRGLLIRLYGAAVCVVVGISLEAIAQPFRREIAWPVSALLFIGVGVAAARLRQWGLSQASDWSEKSESPQPSQPQS